MISTNAPSKSTTDIGTNHSNKARVRRYYAAATEDYLKYYEADWHHHMHYGFERDLPKGGNPTENLVRYLADTGGITAGARVLDAGCGVGGSAIWLAQNRGCASVGITLMEPQARLARGFAERKSPPAQARFSAMDFTAPAFKPGSFDFVWAVESFDHAFDKAAFIAEMAKLLSPGGRIVIADGFRADREFTPRETRQYSRFLEGWAVPHLCTREEMRGYAAEASLKVALHEDISADVAPHAFAIYRFGLFFGPLRFLGHKLGLTSREKLGNAWATYHQYTTFRKGLWTYDVFVLEKAG